MKFGWVTYNIARDWDIPTILDVCKKTGTEGIEARVTHAHGIEPTLSRAERKEIRMQFEDEGIELWGLGTVCEFHSSEPDEVERNIETCRSYVLLAKDLDARGVKVRPNGLRKDVCAERTLEQIADALRDCGDFAADHGAEIWLEAHGPETCRPERMRRVMDLCDHPNVGLCWNSNRSDIENGDGIRKSFELLKPYIRSCHVNELWSDYPYRDLFALLRSSGYDRYSLCEIGTPMSPETGVVFLNCYRGLWNELQNP